MRRQTARLVRRHRASVERVADALLKHRTLQANEIDALIAPTPVNFLDRESGSRHSPRLPDRRHMKRDTFKAAVAVLLWPGWHVDEAAEVLELSERTVRKAAGGEVSTEAEARLIDALRQHRLRIDAQLRDISNERVLRRHARPA